MMADDNFVVGDEEELDLDNVEDRYEDFNRRILVDPDVLMAAEPRFAGRAAEAQYLTKLARLKRREYAQRREQRQRLGLRQV
jgi:hypothetical protein